MKALLTAVKSALQTGLAYVRDGDIFIVPDEHFVPDSVRFPCIGLKDGQVKIKELPCRMMEYSMAVKVVAYVEVLKDEAVIMGDTASGAKGILELETDIHEILDENLLSIPEMISAVATPNQPESELCGDEQDQCQRKIILYDYTKQVARPSVS